MKKFTLALFLVFLNSGFLFAQEKTESINSNTELQSISDKALQRGSESYFIALNRDNQGMIESAISNIMIMKLYFPDRNYDRFISKLTELTTEGSTKQIRFKAFIACNYLIHPERYTWIKKDSFKDTIELFNLFSEKLAKQLEKTEDNLLVLSN